jgi:hypothetical protein
MTTETRTDPIIETDADALHEFINHRYLGKALLDARWLSEFLKNEGWRSKQVENAVRLLVESGRARLSVKNTGRGVYRVLTTAEHVEGSVPW